MKHLNAPLIIGLVLLILINSFLWAGFGIVGNSKFTSISIGPFLQDSLVHLSSDREIEDNFDDSSDDEDEDDSSISEGSSSDSNNDNEFEFTKTEKRVLDRLQNEDKVRVIINLDDKSKQDEILNSLSSFDKKVDMKNGFAGYVDINDLRILEANGLVGAIIEDTPLRPANAQSFPLINVDKATDVNYNQLANLTGKDQTVCIIDTGVSYNHDDLGNCSGTTFLTGNCQKTLTGYDLCGDSANCAGSPDIDPGDENGHGTGVAGIIAGNGLGYKGIVPDAKIVAVKITDANGLGWGSLLNNAVRWCTDNATKYNITMISIGLANDDPIFTYNETFWCANGAIANAVAANITVFAPTGNNEDITEISYPACNEYTISTSAVADGSGITPADVIPNSTYDWGPNRFPGLTDVMAPGSSIYTLTKGDGHSSKAGTSYASAHTVGSAMVLRQYYQERYNYTLTPAEIRDIFVATGKPIQDWNTSEYYPRIDVLKAVHYEEWAPTVNLESSQVINVEPGVNITLEYNTIDNEHNIKNCSLYLNGALDQTDTTITESTTQSFTINSISAGTYNWQVKCYDNSTIPNEGVSPTQTIYVETHTYGSNEGFELIGLDKVINYDKKVLEQVWPTLNYEYLEAKGSHELRGKGQTVAIIDSGLSWAHTEFNGKVLDQWDFYENDNSAQDTWNHGTRMAGIIAAKGVNMEGMAPDADIVSLRITNATGGSWTNKLYDALDWVSNNATKYNITTIYVGMGYSTYEDTDFACIGTSVATKINELTNMNITVVSPAGHDGNITAIAYPACVANTISVGGVPDGGSNFADTWNFTAESIQSNRRDGLLDVVGPGSDGATMTTNRTNYVGGTGIGTSIPAAYVAGASMILREYWEARAWNYSPSGLVNGNIPNTIEYILKQSGKQFEDYRNPGVYYPRIDIYAAINYEEYLPTVNLETPANETTASEGTITFEYNTIDNEHNIKNCSLYIDGSLDQTDTTITESTTKSFTKSLTAGTYNWQIKCFDNSSVPNEGVSETRTITITSSCTEEWVEQIGSCLIDDTQLKTYFDNNSCGTVDNLPADNGTYVSCNYCSYNIVNTTWTSWYDTDVCQPDDTLPQERNLTEYDENYNSCYAVTGLASDLWNLGNNNTHFETQNIACDYCTPNLVNTSWSLWYDSTSCRANDTILQERNLAEYDNNFCGEVSNTTFFEYQEIACNYCSYNVVNSSWTSWYNTDVCQPDDTLPQERNLTEYDENYGICYSITNLLSDLWNLGNNNTYFETQNIACDYCTPNLVNTSWNEWYNISTCYPNNTIDQARNLTQYDNNFCGEISNTTFFEYQSVPCEIPCTENWNVNYGSCQIDDQQLKYYTDGNSCGTYDDLPADNGTYVPCNYCSYNVVNTSWTSWQDMEECQPDDTQDQNRSLTEYDENYGMCYSITNLISDLWNSGNNNTYWEFQTATCDYCTPNLVNTTWTEWIDISDCYTNRTKDQERSLIQFDSNNCGEILNMTFSEYQNINCVCKTVCYSRGCYEVCS